MIGCQDFRSLFGNWLKAFESSGPDQTLLRRPPAFIEAEQAEEEEEGEEQAEEISDQVAEVGGHVRLVGVVCQE